MAFILNRKYLYSSVATSVLMMSALTPQIGLAADITYNGSSEQFLTLPNIYGQKVIWVGENQIQSGNTINIFGSPSPTDTYHAPYYVYGGFIESQNEGNDPTISIENNNINMYGGKVNGSVYGASSGNQFSTTVNLAHNSIFISGGIIALDVYGASGDGQNIYITNITDNSVTVFGDAKMRDVFGGYGYLDANNYNILNVSNNSVVISGSASIGDVYGGSGQTGQFDSGKYEINIINNSVFVSGNASARDIYGGYGDAFGYSGGDISMSVTNNNVIISGNASTSDIYGGYGDSYENLGTVNVTYNRITISDTVSTGAVYGGYFTDDHLGAANLAHNNIVISGNASTEAVYGGFGTSYRDGTVSVTNNNIVISGDASTGSVYGGSGYGRDDSGTVSITNNNVTIRGNASTGSVYGGHIKENSNGAFNITSNTVNLEDNAVINGGVYGSYATNDGNIINDFSSAVAGNTLNLNRYSGSVSGVYNFENYNWLLSKTVANNDTIITITGDAVDLTNTKHTIARENDGKRLSVGDEIILISKASGDADKVPTQVPDHVEQGHFILYNVDVKVDNEQLIMRITGEDAGSNNPKSKSFLEGYAATLGFVGQGSDLIATAGIDNIRVMSRAKEGQLSRPALIPFMITQGSSNRYKTGSHVDIDGFNMAAGLASGFELEQGNKVTLGAFLNMAAVAMTAIAASRVMGQCKEMVILTILAGVFWVELTSQTQV